MLATAIKCISITKSFIATFWQSLGENLGGQNFTRSLAIHGCITVPKSISLSVMMTKLLDLFCNNIIVSHVCMQHNVC